MCTTLLSQVMKCMVIIFVEYVCMYVRCRQNEIMISGRGITGVASHGKRTRATGHAYHDNATRKNKNGG